MNADRSETVKTNDAIVDAQGSTPAHLRPLSFIQTVQAVLWSFFGVRKGKDHRADFARLNPLHLIIAGVLCAVVFILTLLLVVKLVIGFAAK